MEPLALVRGFLFGPSQIIRWDYLLLMKYIISHNQYKLLCEQDTGYSMYLDRMYSTPEGAKKMNDAFKALDPHTLTLILGIGSAFIPVVGPFISTAIGLADAGIYYNEGDKKTAGLVASLSMLPFIGSVVSKIPGVRQLGAKGMASLASKIGKGSKLTQEEINIINAISSNEKLIKTELTTAGKTLQGLTQSLNKLKPTYIDRFGQQSFDDLLQKLLSNKITKEEFLQTLKSSEIAQPQLANFATKFGIKFSQQELNNIKNISNNFLSGKTYQMTLANTKNGLKKIEILLMDSENLAQKGFDVKTVGAKIGDNLIVLNKEKIAGKSLEEIQELIGHEMAHIKDPSMISSKLSSIYKKPQEIATLKNYFLHNWENVAVKSAALQNLVNTTKSWMKYIPKEQLLGYMDEIVNFAKGTGKLYTQGALKMIGNDGLEKLTLLYQNDKKSYIDFLKNLVQQAEYLKSQIKIAM